VCEGGVRERNASIEVGPALAPDTSSDASDGGMTRSRVSVTERYRGNMSDLWGRGRRRASAEPSLVAEC
jgi:hypothetical protein